MVNEMKSKTITQLVLLSLLCLIAIPMVQAEKPEKLVDHHVFEGHLEGIGWCKAVFHGTMIVKDEIEIVGEPTLYDVKATMLQKFILYEEEGGDILAVVKLTLQYVGTVTTLDLPPEEPPTGAFYTGKMVVDVVVNVIADVDLDEMNNAHQVVWYEAGEPVKSRGHGEIPFP